MKCRVVSHGNSTSVHGFELRVADDYAVALIFLEPDTIVV